MLLIPNMDVSPSAIAHISSTSHSFQSALFNSMLLGILNIPIYFAFKCNFYFSIYFHLQPQLHAVPSGRPV